MDDITPPKKKPTPPPERIAVPVDPPAEPPTDPPADPDIDKAVDDIQRADSDTELDAAFAPTPVNEKRSLKQKYLDNKRWTIPVTVLVVILIAVFAVPATRYKVLGLFVSHTYDVTFTDSTTHNPVTSAVVHLDSQTATTNAKGTAEFTHVKPGNHQVSVSKQYYQTFSEKLFVGLGSPPAQTKTLVATGRQVTVTAINAITGKAVSGADIAVLDTSAKTDDSGTAHMVLPADKASATAKISASGYNTSSGAVQVLAKTASVNSFKLVPSGRVYFLSNRSGKVDIISTNYDGSDRQTLLAGTGYEDSNNTQLITSPDQKYVALIGKRTSTDGGIGLYIVSTATGKLAKAEESANVGINQIGWSGDYFVYALNNYGSSQWQNGQQLLKSYNAATNAAATLDQTQAEGDQDQYDGQNFTGTVTIIDGLVLYGTYWTTNSPGQIDSKTDTINSVQPNGTGKKALRSLTVPAGATYVSLTQELATPEITYFEMPTSTADASNGAIFFKYQNGNLTQTNSFTYANFTDPNIANGYVSLSPSGSTSLFQDSVDGHLVVSTGDSTGANKQKVISLSTDGDIKGWLSDNYILVSQNTNQLYVVPAAASPNMQPLLVSDFLVPPHANN